MGGLATAGRLTVLTADDTPRMANTVLRSPSFFPNGTVVTAYPWGASVNFHRGNIGKIPGHVSGVESKTVASDIATFTTLVTDQPYLIAGDNGKSLQMVGS